MSSGFMAGSHEAKARSCSVWTFGTGEPQTSVLLSKNITFNISVGPTSNSSKRLKGTFPPHERSLGILRRKVCRGPHFEKRRGPEQDGAPCVRAPPGAWGRTPRAAGAGRSRRSRRSRRSGARAEPGAPGAQGDGEPDKRRGAARGGAQRTPL